MQRRRHVRTRPVWLVAGVAAALAAVTLAGRAATDAGSSRPPATVSYASAIQPGSSVDTGAEPARTGIVTAAARALTASPAQEPRPWVAPVGARDDQSFSPHRASFSLTFRGQVSPYQLMSVFVMPGERLELGVADPGGRRFTAEAQTGELASSGPTSWTWRAPEEPGRVLLRITDNARGGDTVYLNAFVKVPYDGSEYLNGYRIGQYAPGTDGTNRPPQGFVELTPENAGTWISPHFRLEQFLCKQEAAYPKYLLVQEALLLKLERVLEEVNVKGIEAHTFHVMSSFRTPFYNRAIGNTTTYSRHVFGDAADVFVDQNGDGWMDDLTGTGVVDQRDAQLIYDLVEELHRGDVHFHQSFNGGMGLYAPRPGVHPPFVHVDTRGYRARW